MKKKNFVFLFAFVLSLLCLGTPRQARATSAGIVAGPSSVQHTITRGETLMGISKNTCNDLWLYKQIASENGIQNPDLIIAGKTISVSCARETAKHNVEKKTTSSFAANASGINLTADKIAIRSYVRGQAKLLGVNPDVADWIVTHESSYNPLAAGDGGHSRGIWQINLPYHHDVSEHCAKDVQCSTHWSLKRILSGKVNDWTTWRFRHKFYRNAPRITEVTLRKDVSPVITRAPLPYIPKPIIESTENASVLTGAVITNPEFVAETFTLVSYSPSAPAPIPPPQPAAFIPAQPLVSQPMGRVKAYRIGIQGLAPRIYPAYLLSNKDRSGDWQRKKIFVEVQKKGGELFAYLPFNKLPRKGSEVDLDPGGTAPFQRFSYEEIRKAEPVYEALPKINVPKTAYASLNENFPAHRSQAAKIARITLTYGVPIAMGFKFGGPIGLIPVGMSLGGRLFGEHVQRQVQNNAQAAEINKLEIQNIELQKQLNDLRLTILQQGGSPQQNQQPEPEVEAQEPTR